MKSIVSKAALRRFIALGLGVLLGSSLVLSAQAKPTPLYGGDYMNSPNGITLNQDAREGTNYNTFNRLRDSIYLCEQLGHMVSPGKCDDNVYMDEREFVSVRKIPTRTTSGVAATGGDSRYFHNYTGSDLKKGDLLRTYFFIHNDAKTITSEQYTARDVRATLTIQGSRLLGVIKAKNTFVEEPSPAVLENYKPGRTLPNVEATFEDDASINLPQGLGLKFFSVRQATVEGLVSYCGPSSTKEVCDQKFLGNPLQLSGSSFSLNGKSLTYNIGDLVGSKKNIHFLVVDLQVVEGGDDDDDNDRERPGTYQICVLGTPNLRFVWDNAQAGDTMTVLRSRGGTEESYTYIVNRSYGSVDNLALRNASGQILTTQPGDRIRWRVGRDSRFSQWYEDTVINCQGLQDNLRLENLAPCASPTFRPQFAWDTPGRTKKLQVSTDQNFSFYWTKDISGLNRTSGPEGFSYFEPRTDRPLEFRGNIRYYWRIVEDGKIYPGVSFQVPICDVECIDNGYTGDDDSCEDDKIVPPKVVQEECVTCACVEIFVDPSSAGDFNIVTFTVRVSNQAFNSNTISKKVILQNLRPDLKKGYTLQYGPEGNWQPMPDNAEQGSFDVTAVRLDDRVGIKYGSNRPANAEKIAVDFSAFASDQTKPVIINNLYPGDYVDLEVKGIVRTSKPGKAFAEATKMVNYTYFMKSQSNNGAKALTIARPFLITTNDGDQVLRNTVLRGLSELERVIKDVTGTYPAISGATITNAGGRITQSNLGFSNTLSTVVVLQNQNKTAGTATINSEADLQNKLNIRPDQTRIFSTKNQNVEFGTTGSSKIDITQRSTVYVEFAGQRGTVNINTDIVYAAGGQVPAFALVVKNGDIVIHPRVKQLDGVYVVLGGGKFAGTDGWMKYYEAGNQPQALVVNGALYGNIEESLIPSRPNVRLTEGNISRQGLIEGSGIAINFDGRIYSFPAPGLKEIIGGVYELLREQR